MTIALVQAVHVHSGLGLWSDSSEIGTYPTNPTVGSALVGVVLCNRNRDLHATDPMDNADGDFTLLVKGFSAGGTPNYGGGICGAIAASTTNTVTSRTSGATDAGTENFVLFELSDVLSPLTEVGTSGENQEATGTTTHSTGDTFDPGGVSHYILFHHAGFSGAPGTITPAAAGWTVVGGLSDSTRYLAYKIVDGSSATVDMSFTTGSSRQSYAQWAAIQGNTAAAASVLNRMLLGVG